MNHYLVFIVNRSNPVITLYGPVRSLHFGAVIVRYIAFDGLAGLTCLIGIFFDKGADFVDLTVERLAILLFIFQDLGVHLCMIHNAMIV